MKHRYRVTCTAQIEIEAASEQEALRLANTVLYEDEEHPATFPYERETDRWKVKPLGFVH